MDKDYNFENLSELLKNNELPRKSFIKRYFQIKKKLNEQIKEKDNQINQLQEQLNQNEQNLRNLKGYLP